MSTMPGKMTKFRIRELSGVDKPAQQGAKALFMKRDESPAHGGQPEGATMPNAIKKALGLADTATDAEVEAAIVAKVAGGDTAIAKALEPVQAALAVAKAKAAMTDKEKAFAAGQKMDDAAVCKFMEQTPEARATEIAKADSGDEVLEVAGATIRKSVVGDGMFAIVKAQAAQIEANAAAIAKANDTAANATFAKRAVDEFPHLVGTVEERSAVLKHLSGAPPAVQKAAEAILKAAEATAKLAFSKLGTIEMDDDGEATVTKNDGDATVTKSEAKLTKLANDLVAKDATLSFAKAYDQAATANPQLYEAALRGE